MTSAPADFWDDPELSSGIDESIDRHRKSVAVVRVKDSAGKPLAGIPVAGDQLDSSFHFGANIFMLDGFSSAELNRRYEEAYCSLFNAATVPFYWKGLEPEQGGPRFAADSPFVPRRPPPDRVVAFCKERGLKMHGHTLVWNSTKYSVPSWLPENPEEALPLWKNWIRKVARRYGGRIPRWDVLNERVINYPPPDGFPLQDGYEHVAFSWAQEEFPRDAEFFINEVSWAWIGFRAGYQELIRRLLDGGARIDGIGLQFHLFQDSELRDVLAGKLYAPAQLLETLDALAGFNLPIHVSEITITSPENSPAGLRDQARVATSLYRLWFCHPSVEGITWWNVPDGGAAPDENKVYPGLLDSRLDPKPSYEALKNLLHSEWRTHQAGVTDRDGCFRFRGFQGRYRAVVTDAGSDTSAEWVLDKSGCSTVDLTLRTTEP